MRFFCEQEFDVYGFYCHGEFAGFFDCGSCFIEVLYVYSLFAADEHGAEGDDFVYCFAEPLFRQVVYGCVFLYWWDEWAGVDVWVAYSSDEYAWG